MLSFLSANNLSGMATVTVLQQSRVHFFRHSFEENEKKRSSCF
jgi:hypothetical protein